MTVEEAGKLVTECFLSGGKVLVCGNGGSAAESGHFVGELMGAFRRRDRAPLPAINLCADTTVLTAIANDYGFEQVFARQLEGLGHEGDLLIAISTSGNSENVLEAVGMARVLGMDVIALTCGVGGQLALEVPDDHVLASPTRDTAEGQEWHLKALHDIAGYVERHYFADESLVIVLHTDAAIEGTA